MLINRKEKTEIVAYWVTDGEDHCRVGFLQPHMVAHRLRYNGGLVQVTRVLDGNAGAYDTAEHWLYHKNKGFDFATIITALPVMKKVEAKVEREDNGGRKKRKSGNNLAVECINVD